MNMWIIAEINKLLTEPLPQYRSNNHQSTGDIIAIQITNQKAIGKLKIAFVKQQITLGLVAIKTIGHDLINNLNCFSLGSILLLYFIDG